MKKILITLSIFSAFDASALIANCDVNGGPVTAVHHVLQVKRSAILLDLETIVAKVRN